MSSEAKEMLKFAQLESFSSARITADAAHLLLQRGGKIKLVGVRWKAALVRGVSPAQRIFCLAWPDQVIGTQLYTQGH